MCFPCNMMKEINKKKNTIYLRICVWTTVVKSTVANSSFFVPSEFLLLYFVEPFSRNVFIENK